MSPTTSPVVTVSTQAGLRHHKATCNRIRREQIVGDPSTHTDPAIPVATCCKLTREAVDAARNAAKPAGPVEVISATPEQAQARTRGHASPKGDQEPPDQCAAAIRKAFAELTDAAKAVVRERAWALYGGDMTTVEAWTAAVNETVTQPAAPAKAKAPAAKKAADQVVEAGPAKPDVTFYVNGKPRLQRTSPRPYTFSYLAGETVGGKGSSAKLRDMLAKAGIADPEHTNWDFTLPNGKTIGARIPGAEPPAVPEKPAKAEKAAGSAQKLADLKAEAEAVKAWKAGGEKGPRPETPLTDRYNAAQAEADRAKASAKAERDAAEKAAKAERASKRQEAAKGAA